MSFEQSIMNQALKNSNIQEKNEPAKGAEKEVLVSQENHLASTVLTKTWKIFQ